MTRDVQTPEPGALLADKYRIVRVLGRGGMGTVFEAEHQLSGRRVALKWMHLASSRDPEAAERFLREARACARLRHRNIVDVYDVESIDDAAFLVMELLDGETLGAWLARRGHSVSEAIGLLLPAMRGVVKAHELGVVHRDIKPDNIFLSRQDGEDGPIPKVLDFGVSKVLDSEALSMTRAGATIGTPQYMSLEQLYGQNDVDHRTDIYAFGVILYEAVTGRLPFDASAISELAVKIATTAPPDPRQFRPGLQDGLDKIIERALAKLPADRYANLAEMIEALRPFTTPSFGSSVLPLQPLAASGVGASGLAGSPSQSMLSADDEPGRNLSQQLRRRRRRTLAIVAGLFALALAGLSLGLGRQPHEQTASPAPSVLEPRREAPAEPVPEVLDREAPAVVPSGREPPPNAARASSREHARKPEPAAPVTRNAVSNPSTAQPSPRAEEKPAAPVAPVRPSVPAAPVVTVQFAPPAQPSTLPPIENRAVAPARAQTRAPQPLAPAPRAAPPTLASSYVPAPPQLVTGSQRGVTLSASSLKRAYAAKALSADDYRDYLHMLDLWRRQAQQNLQRALAARQIDRAGYQRALDAIERTYRGP